MTRKQETGPVLAANDRLAESRLFVLTEKIFSEEPNGSATHLKTALTDQARRYQAISLRANHSALWLAAKPH
jgi:hypothetical protein